MKLLLRLIVVTALMHVGSAKAAPEVQEAEVAETKEKVTFNLSDRIIEMLDDAWMQLRKQLRDQQRVTKTFIVEQATRDHTQRSANAR